MELNKKHNFFDNVESKALIDILNKSKHTLLMSDEYDVCFKIFRDHYILRWTIEDILNDKIKVKDIGYHYITLKESLTHNTAVKIDMISLINGRFIEVTNYVVLIYEYNKDYYYINVDPAFAIVAEIQLPFDIEKLYYSNMHYNTFKMVKRMYALARNLRLNSIVEKILPIVGSSISEIYQIKNELNVILLILTLFLKKIKDLPMPIIHNQLDDMKIRLAKIVQINTKTLDKLIILIDKSISESKIKNLIEDINKIKNILIKKIDYYTIEYLTKNGLNPPPVVLLPVKESYDWSIYRSIKGIYGGSIFGTLAGKSFQTMANAYRKRFCNGKARMLQNGEYHLGCHNFSGPGTRIHLPEVINKIPYNNIDGCSKKHDIAYMHANTPEKIRQADIEALKCYDQFKNESGYLASKSGINSKMKLENAMPFLIKSIAPSYFGK